MDKRLVRLLELEKLFSTNSYDGLENKKYILKKGKIPILISAPHAVNESTLNSVKVSDILTGGIALILSELTECYTIVKCYNDGIDPNHSNIGKDDNYKEKICEIIKENDIKLMIDLHGLRYDRDSDIDIVTNNRKTIGYDENIINNLEIYLKENNIFNVTENKYFVAKSEKIIVHKVWNDLKIPSIELEINFNYRNINEPNNLLNLLKALEKFILNYK